MSDAKFAAAGIAYRPVGPGDHVFLVDGSSFVFRAYFQSINQDAKYNYRSDGLPTGAVRLFTTKLYQFLREGAVGIRPTHLGIVFDKTEQTFRKDIYADYKANRREPPDDLVPQFPLMREAVRAFGLEPIEKGGYEADDLIATYARQAEAAGADALIISADKDLMQIVSPRVQFYDFESGAKGKPGYRPERKIDVAGVIEYFGAPPEKVIDIQALVGDTSDNVPGVPGIGIKTAAQLLAEFGDLESLLARVAEIKQPKRRESLIQFAEQARLSKRLVTLDSAVPLDVELAALEVPSINPSRLIAFVKALELTTLTKRIAEAFAVEAEGIEADPKLKAKPKLVAAPVAPAAGADLFGGPPRSVSESPATRGGPVLPAEAPPFSSPAANVAAITTEMARIGFDRAAYQRIDTRESLGALVAEGLAGGVVALAGLTTSIDPMRADLCGLAFATTAGRAAYLPLGHREGGAADLLGGGLVPGQLATGETLDRLRPLLEDRSVIKVGEDIKHLALVLARHGVDLTPIDDTMLLAYALEGGRAGTAMGEVAERLLGRKAASIKDALGAGREKIAVEQLTIAEAAAILGEQADVTLRLWRILRARLSAERMTAVYETLERPLVAVLARMERAGVLVDRQILSRLSGEFAQTLARLEAEVADLAGEPFNIASPKQLGDILFGKFGLPGGKKTKTGAWSTGADILEELAAEGHALPARILDWRQLAKLKSTYTDPLPSYIHPETGRVHTSYALAATPTGRLSSSEPNLQNIPVRTEEGRRIRTAFIAAPGTALISADYSQIELRVLAHIADIPQLRQAFADGLDIHAMTASEMFGVPVEGMPADVRRRAKAINFGIIYGISAFGLANQLGIPRAEAGDYIQRYFSRFPGIRDYMEAMKAAVKKDGHVSTLFGRRIHFPQIASKNPAERAFVERASINAPIQGSAADIMRRAMVRIEPALAAARLSAKMLLQVHDELVFEAPLGEVAATIPLVASIMEKAAEPAIATRVPLKVDARAADNWEAAH